jgi:hypothetical protein
MALKTHYFLTCIDSMGAAGAADEEEVGGGDGQPPTPFGADLDKETLLVGVPVQPE